MSKRIPIGTAVAVRWPMTSEWEPAFVVGYSVIQGFPFAYHVQLARHVYDSFVRDPDIVAVRFE